MPTHRKIARYGWHPSPPDHRDIIWNKHNEVKEELALPKKFSWRDQMPPVYQQGDLGSCTGNGIAGCLEYEQIKQNEGSQTPSRLFIYYNERVIEGTVNTDSGANIRDGIKVVASEGAPPETLWPYDISKFATPPPQSVYDAATKHEALRYESVKMGGPGTPIRSAIHQRPLVFGFSVPSYFEDGWDPTAGPLPLPDDSTQYIGGHCVIAVGWDFSGEQFSDPVFEVRNSWGEEWGNGGYFWMDYRWFSPEYSSDMWIITLVK